MIDKIELLLVASIAKKAGDAIMQIYNDPKFSKVVDFKSDKSPLTLADIASNNVIIASLNKNYPDVPIISEEGKDTPYILRKNWEYYWLVDPLDGTKEFIKRNGEFTVNIALIHKNKPVIGVVYTPVDRILYYGTAGKKAFKQVNENAPVEIRVNHKKGDLIAVRSKSHAAEEEEKVLEKYGVKESISIGSSLKFCMVAEGKADIYYRHGPTMEWDTAAGNAIVEAAGGKVFKGTGSEDFDYNKESMLNEGFLCLGGKIQLGFIGF